MIFLILQSKKDEKSEMNHKEFLEIAKQTLMRIIDVNAESKDIIQQLENELSFILKEIEQRGDNLMEFNPNLAKNSGYIAEDYDQFIFEKLLRVAFDKKSSHFNSPSDANKSTLGRNLRDIFVGYAEAHRAQGDFRSVIECYEKAIGAEENMGKVSSE